MEKAYPVYRSSRGGQDVYVDDVTASSAREAIDTFALAVGIEGGVRVTTRGQERVQTGSVLFYYTYADESAREVCI